MIKILFVCHGNICRSPMAEFLMKDYVAKCGTSDCFDIESKATSSEEIGNPVHPETAKILRNHHIDCRNKKAQQVQDSDEYQYDFIIGMDRENVSYLQRKWTRSAHKIYRLLDFTEHPKDIADPWYTGNFRQSYQDIMEGIEAFYRYLTCEFSKK